MNTKKQYVQAFNNGYILEQYKSDFSKILCKHLTPTNNYLRGFLAGNKQFGIEKINYQLLEIDGLRNQGQKRENEHELD